MICSFSSSWKIDEQIWKGNIISIFKLWNNEHSFSSFCEREECVWSDLIFWFCDFWSDEHLFFASCGNEEWVWTEMQFSFCADLLSFSLFSFGFENENESNKVLNNEKWSSAFFNHPFYIFYISFSLLFLNFANSFKNFILTKTFFSFLIHLLWIE
jgi:hypothetical protein